MNISTTAASLISFNSLKFCTVTLTIIVFYKSKTLCWKGVILWCQTKKLTYLMTDNQLQFPWKPFDKLKLELPRWKKNEKVEYNRGIVFGYILLCIISGDQLKDLSISLKNISSLVVFIGLYAFHNFQGIQIYNTT